MADVHQKYVALVTGANRGLGLEFTKQLLERGFSVIGCCRTPDKATELSASALIPSSDTSLFDC